MSTGLIHILPDPNIVNEQPELFSKSGGGGVEVPGPEDDASGFKLGNFSVDEERPVKVVVIGAGFSGITAAIRLPQHISGLHLTVYEKHAGVGGTWYANRYPGIACDVPAHCYQLTFELETQWSAFFSPGLEVLQYLQRIADKYKLDRYLKLSHELVRAEWDEEARQWRLSFKNLISGDLVEDTADVVLNCMGLLHRWTWPNINGLHSFQGKLMHSADWERGLEVGRGTGGEKFWNGKRVAVIGFGSSAIQMVPALQPHVAHLDNYVRGKTWIASPFAASELNKVEANASNHVFTEEEKKRFREDPEYYMQWRHDLEHELNSVHGGVVQGHRLQMAAVEMFTAMMKERLKKRPWIADHIIPDFPVGCRRLTPGPGYLEALCEDNVGFIPTAIQRVTETGIETMDGEHREYDVIVCATGFNVDFQYKFPIVGRGGLTIQERFTPIPVSYMTIATDGFPNWFHVFGPNSALGSGSLLVLYEKQVDYVVQAILKMQRERIDTVEVKPEAVRDWQEYVKHYFPTTVYSGNCHSWYKTKDGDNIALWPGSCLHAVRTLTHPRWEDWNYTRRGNVKNRLHWLGDGWTENEKYLKGDRAWYYNDVDIPPVPQ